MVRIKITNSNGITIYIGRGGNDGSWDAGDAETLLPRVISYADPTADEAIAHVEAERFDRIEARNRLNESLRLAGRS